MRVYLRDWEKERESEQLSILRLGSRGSREFNFQKEAQERFCKGEELSSLLEGSYMLSSHFGYEIEHNGVFCSVFFSLKKYLCIYF